MLGELKKNKHIIFSVFAAVLISNYIFVVHGYTGPDGYLEGIARYSGAGWALRLGRWALVYLNMVSVNIVLPQVWLLVSAASVSLVAILLVKMWDIEKNSFQILAAISIAVAPAVVSQYLYIYMELAYAFALLFSFLFSYIVIEKDKSPLHFTAAALCLAFSLGCYQSYIGLAAGVVLLSLALQLFRGEEIKTVLKNAGYSLGAAAAGCLLYYLVLRLHLALFHTSLSSYSGADQIGFVNSAKNLLRSLRSTYVDFWAYLVGNEPDLVNGASGPKQFPIATVPLLGMTLLLLILQIRRIRIKEYVLLLVLIALAPLAFNCITIAAPDRSVNLLMSHQMQFIFPFFLALVQHVLKSTELKAIGKKLLIAAAVAVAALGCWVCILAAHATHYTLTVSGEFLERYSSALLADVQRTDGYRQDARVVFVGVPDESGVKQHNPLYSYSLYRYDRSGLLWDDHCWDDYLRESFQTDIDTLSDEEFQALTESEEFAGMGIYPGENSIRWFGDVLVVKTGEVQ